MMRGSSWNSERTGNSRPGGRDGRTVQFPPSTSTAPPGCTRSAIDAAVTSPSWTTTGRTPKSQRVEVVTQETILRRFQGNGTRDKDDNEKRLDGVTSHAIPQDARSGDIVRRPSVNAGYKHQSRSQPETSALSSPRSSAEIYRPERSLLSMHFLLWHCRREFSQLRKKTQPIAKSSGRRCPRARRTN